MDQSDSTAANPVRPSRKATRRRWLQFSLRGVLVVLTIGCLWLGWKVEMARKRGRAIDAIVEAGGVGGYGDSGDAPFLSRGRSVEDHFWLDLKGVPVVLAINTHLNATLAYHLSRVYAIKELDILIPPTDQEVRHLEGVQGKCKIRFYNTNERSHAALEELQRRLPDAIIVWGNEE